MIGCLKGEQKIHYNEEINYGTITGPRFMLHSARTLMCFGRVMGCLNETDPIPQPVFYKSVAGRRENSAIILRVGYSSNNGTAVGS